MKITSTFPCCFISSYKPNRRASQQLNGRGIGNPLDCKIAGVFLGEESRQFEMLKNANVIERTRDCIHACMCVLYMCIDYGILHAYCKGEFCRAQQINSLGGIYKLQDEVGKMFKA